MLDSEMTAKLWCRAGRLPYLADVRRGSIKSHHLHATLHESPYKERHVVNSHVIAFPDREASKWCPATPVRLVVPGLGVHTVEGHAVWPFCTAARTTI